MVYVGTLNLQDSAGVALLEKDDSGFRLYRGLEVLYWNCDGVFLISFTLMPQMKIQPHAHNSDGKFCLRGGFGRSHFSITRSLATGRGGTTFDK